MSHQVRSRSRSLYKSGSSGSSGTGFLASPLGAAVMPFINGGIAGMTATAVIQPIDMVKVRIQLNQDKHGASAFNVARNIIRDGRVLDLYAGLSAGLLRQAVYTTARLGLFDTFISKLNSAKTAGNNVTFLERSAAGLAAGGLAAFIGNPADLALIRMQSDGLKPAHQRENYKNVIDALTRITRSEGITALWTGCSPTVVRAMALNLGQLSGFSQAKSFFKKNNYINSDVTGILKSIQRNDTYTVLAASSVAGFFASFLSLPFDFVKTRIQKQVKGPNGELTYKGVLDCVSKTLRDEGILRFWRGFGTYYFRIAPHAMVTLIVADGLAKLLKRQGGLA